MGFNGKAIYNPSGKAKEYSAWACNFYTGCSNNCQYCYCKRGVMSHVWSTTPQLKKCFTSEQHAFEVFCRELDKCEDLIGSVGLLFSFTTDPLLPETRDLTFWAMEEAISRGINVKILTKRADWLDEFIRRTKNQTINYGENKHRIAFGFTLTGCDELEPHAASNHDRVREMLRLHNLGYRTFASIEPIIKIDASFGMINMISGWCDLIKIGLLSGKRNYGEGELEYLYGMIQSDNRGSKFYLKDSFVSALGIDRSALPPHFVNSDHNIFQPCEESPKYNSGLASSLSFFSQYYSRQYCSRLCSEEQYVPQF